MRKTEAQTKKEQKDDDEDDDDDDDDDDEEEEEEEVSTKDWSKLSEKDGSTNASSVQTVKAVSQPPWRSCTGTVETLRRGIY